ncbi:FAD-binding oxidoreductase [uncultured Jatrophihabitans sp.]|uniref:FAD-binding oxidoreductase n=1 Tax=uncultured Jatrophihabitans sp. TaxID=1610747 RepID=UPI0035CA5EE4
MTDGAELLAPGDKAYAAATRPHNSVGVQRPAFVARPQDADDVAAVVAECARRGLTALPQATGHGAGGTVGDDTVLVDTSALNDIAIDAQAAVARVGAGVTWGAVNAAAEQHGLLGLAGSAPSVCPSGYTFGGGIGWLCRPHGMAAGALRSVVYVDGQGTVRTASDDAADELDREAIFAFRGGGGVGIATTLEFDLFAVEDLYAGYLLWPAEALDAVVAAWVRTIDDVGDDVSTSISLLHAPPAPPFPEALRGTPVVHLAVAASRGPAGAQVLLDSVRSAVEPAADTWGKADAATLGSIHLDPPPGTPAIGQARWLDASAPGLVAAALTVAAPADAPLAMIEVRSVGNTAAARPGAESSVPGPFVVHAVGGPPAGEDGRRALQQAFDAVRAAVAPADTGRSLGSWVEGATSVPDALPVETRTRVREIADHVDPHGTIARSRVLV